MGGSSCKKISLVVFQVYLTPKYTNGYPKKIVPPGQPQITSSSGSDKNFIFSVPHFVPVPFLYYTIDISFFALGGVPLRSMNIIVYRVQREVRNSFIIFEIIALRSKSSVLRTVTWIIPLYRKFYNLYNTFTYMLFYL